MHRTGLTVSDRLKFSISSSSCGNFNHMWHIRPKKLYPNICVPELRKVLSFKEKQRMDGFKFFEDQHTFLLSRSTLKVLIGKYIDILPESLQISYAEKGKPYIDMINKQIHFNLSHTKDHISILVSSHECGVDVEKIDFSFPVDEVAKECFSPPERRELLCLNGESKVRYFFQIWTLKEAYLKATGEGITTGLTRLSFTTSKSGEIELKDLSSNTVVRDWIFNSYPFLEDSYISSAVKTSPREIVQTISWLPCGTLDLCNGKISG